MAALKFPPDLSLIIGIILLIISIVFYIMGVWRRIRTNNSFYKKVTFWLLMVLNTCNMIYIITKIIIPAWNGNPV